MSKTTVIGIDFSADPRRVGITVCESQAERLAAIGISLGRGKQPTIIDAVAERIPSDSRTLIAIDAPLGWPAELEPALKDHVAGQGIQAAPDTLFMRCTDRLVMKRIKKRPFEVGASWIARTAHAALRFLESLRRKTGKRIPLVWEPGFVSSVGVIEVYPRATLFSYSLPCEGYKRNSDSGRKVRQTIVEGLSRAVDLGSRHPDLIKNDNLLDSAVCALAGADFLRGKALSPLEDRKLVEQEGWIWSR